MRCDRTAWLPWVAALCTVSGPAPAVAVPGGQLATLEAGRWTCELPGDAEQVSRTLPAESFFAIKDSSYRLADPHGGMASGTYLLLGDQLTMTSGPFEGRRYKLEGHAILHRLDAGGTATTLRCVRGNDPAAIAAEVPGQFAPAPAATPKP